MGNSSPRRWFRYNLRTLFVVVSLLAIPLAWTAYSLNWIRQRHEFLAAEEVHDQSGGGGMEPESRPVAPGLLWMFGEKGISNLVVMGSDAAKFSAAGPLFPEAKIFHHPHDVFILAMPPEEPPGILPDDDPFNPGAKASATQEESPPDKPSEPAPEDDPFNPCP